MLASLIIINRCPWIIRVFSDDLPIFSCILPGEVTHPKNLSVGSRRIVVESGREKQVFDLWLPVSPTLHTLEIFEKRCRFT